MHMSNVDIMGGGKRTRTGELPFDEARQPRGVSSQFGKQPERKYLTSEENISIKSHIHLNI